MVRPTELSWPWVRQTADLPTWREEDDAGEPVDIAPDFRQRLLGHDVRVVRANTDDGETVAFVRLGKVMGDFCERQSAASIPFCESDHVRVIVFDDVHTVQAAWRCVSTYWRQQGLPLDG